MTRSSSNLLVGCALLLLVTIVYGDITYLREVGVPLNGSVTLSCNVLHNETEWLHDNDVIVSNGELHDKFNDRFNFTCSYTQWCELTIFNAKVEHSGIYRCNSHYFKRIYKSYVSVLALPAPWNVMVHESTLVGGQRLTLRCSVVYHGPRSPDFDWELNGCTPCGETASQRTVYNLTTSQLVTTSELRIIVPTDAEYLPNYTCSIDYSHYDYYSQTSLKTEYRWKARRIKVSYCPRRVWASGMHENFKVNSKLSCGSDSYPAAQHQWNIIRGSGFVDGQFFVVDSPGFFNVSCTAFNYIKSLQDCSMTVYTTGYVPSPQRGQSDVDENGVNMIVYVLCGVVGLLVIVIVVLVISLIVCARKRKKLTKRRANDFIERPAAMTMGGLDHQRDSGVYLSVHAAQPEPVYEYTSYRPRHS